MKNKNKRLIVLALLTVGVVFFVSYFMKTWMAISVPLFMIGVWVADCPDFFKNHFFAFCGSFLALCVLAILVLYQPITIHAVINYLVILALIIAAYFFNVKLIGVSALVGVFSFDIYLTHNKARMLTFALWEHPSYWVYLLIMVVFTVIFHYLKRVILPKY